MGQAPGASDDFPLLLEDLQFHNDGSRCFS